MVINRSIFLELKFRRVCVGKIWSRLFYVVNIDFFFVWVVGRNMVCNYLYIMYFVFYVIIMFCLRSVFYCKK